MAAELIKLLIDKEHNPRPSVSRQIDNISWKFSVQENDEIGMYLEVECKPIETVMYWECDVNFVIRTKSGTFSHQMSKHTTFSNYTTVSRINILERTVDSVILSFESPILHMFEFTKEALFDEPVDKITDFKLIVEGQTLYVCKKILATYSKHMYTWFDDESSQTQYSVSKTSCNVFRVFIGILCHQKSLLTIDNVNIIVNLACRFEALHCLEECEQFLKLASMDSLLKWNELSRIKYIKQMEGMGNETYNILTSLTVKRSKLTDVALSVGDKKFYVSKQLLAYHSSYFYTMFFSDFVEKNKDEIELKGIDANEFEMFLQFFHYPNRVIEVEGIEAIFTLSQMYDAQSVTRKCIHILQVHRGANDIKKIQIASKFNVLDRVIDKLNFIDLTRLYSMEGFNELDDTTTAKLLRLLLEKQQKQSNSIFEAARGLFSQLSSSLIQRL